MKGLIRNHNLINFSALLLTLIYLIGITPTAEYFLVDPDGGNQLAGAQQISQYHEYPHVDFLDSYGIFRYGVSALGKFFVGPYLISEILVRIIGFLLGYIILFFLSSKYNKQILMPFVILLSALFLLPRHHKYFVILLPYLSLLAMYFYSRRSSISSLILLSFAVGIAGLYRHDYGLFCFLGAGGVVVFNYQNLLTQRIKHLFVLTFVSSLTVILVMMIIFKNINIYSYLHDIIYISFAKSEGLSLPHPIFNYYNPSLSLVFLVFHLIPILFCILILRYRQHLESENFAFFCGLGILALANLVQAGHRADYSHLLQGIFPVYLCVAIIYGVRRLFYVDKFGKILPRIIIILFFSGIIIATSSLNKVVSWQPLGEIKRTFTLANQSKQNYLQQILKEKPNFIPAKIPDELNRCSSEDERIIVYPFDPQIYYFANRGFGSKLRILAPGEYNSEYYQLQIIDSIQSHRVSFILWDEKYTYDKEEDRNSTLTHSILHKFVQTHYYSAGKLGRFSVYTPNPSTIYHSQSLCPIEIK